MSEISFQDKKLIIQGRNNRCLEADIENKVLIVNICDETNANMKWDFGTFNRTALNNFEHFGAGENSR